jgi:predicted helicase
LVASDIVPNLNLYSADSKKYACLQTFDKNGNRIDNITDWALEKFTQHYTPASGQDSTARSISKQDIFHYCYAVLHHPAYREKYAQNLKREFPRIPFYANFWRWADWGAQLMALHIGFETVPPFALTRTDTPDVKTRAAGLTPKDPTIRAKFDTYRFADYKEKVIDLLARVTNVSVQTVAITQAMQHDVKNPSGG